MNLEDWSKEELINYIHQLKSGLKFQARSEDNEKILPEHFINLNQTNNSLILNPDFLNNLLVIGNNLYLLLLLASINCTCDFIYIDPPYNTGNQDFIYNDKFIDENDGFKHTKWLNFMQKRLILARQLLADDGIICISIDDNEQAYLKLLCDEIFGENNFLQQLIWISSPNGRSDSKYLAKKHEYVLIYAKDSNNPHLQFNKRVQNMEVFKQTDSKGPYYLFDLNHVLTYSTASDYLITAPDGSIIYPSYNQTAYARRKTTHKKKEKIWRWSKKRLEQGIVDGEVVFKKNKNGDWRVYTKVRPNIDLTKNASFNAYYDTENTKHGSTQLQEVLTDKSFDHPKPTGLIKYLLNLLAKKDIKVLDFFAGSGTTGQAVLEMNAVDGQKRTFVLNTINENQYIENTTLPRLKTLITGKRPDDSSYNASFRKDGISTEFIPYNVNDFQSNLYCFELELKATKQSSTSDIKSLCQIQTGCFNIFKHNKFFEIYLNETNGLVIINKSLTQGVLNKIKLIIRNLKQTDWYVLLDSIPENLDLSIFKKVFSTNTIYKHYENLLNILNLKN